MTITAISIYSGGTLDEVMPLVKQHHALLAKHGINYRLSRFDTGPNKGDWLVLVTYHNHAAYDAAQEWFAQNPEYQQIVAEIAKYTTRLSRELADDIDL
jgi:hypothetical protein